MDEKAASPYIQKRPRNESPGTCKKLIDVRGPSKNDDLRSCSGDAEHAALAPKDVATGSSLGWPKALSPTQQLLTRVPTQPQWIPSPWMLSVSPQLQDHFDKVELSWTTQMYEISNEAYDKELQKQWSSGGNTLNTTLQGLHAYERMLVNNFVKKQGDSASIVSARRVKTDIYMHDILFRELPGFQVIIQGKAPSPTVQQLPPASWCSYGYGASAQLNRTSDPPMIQATDYPNSWDSQLQQRQQEQQLQRQQYEGHLLPRALRRRSSNSDQFIIAQQQEALRRHQAGQQVVPSNTGPRYPTAIQQLNPQAGHLQEHANDTHEVLPGHSLAIPQRQNQSGWHSHPLGAYQQQDQSAQIAGAEQHSNVAHIEQQHSPQTNRPSGDAIQERARQHRPMARMNREQQQQQQYPRMPQLQQQQVAMPSSVNGMSLTAEQRLAIQERMLHMEQFQQQQGDIQRQRTNHKMPVIYKRASKKGAYKPRERLSQNQRDQAAALRAEDTIESQSQAQEFDMMSSCKYDNFDFESFVENPATVPFLAHSKPALEGTGLPVVDDLLKQYTTYFD